MEWSHLKRLFLIDGLGLVLGITALALKTRVKLGWLLVLGLILVFGLSRILNRSVREADY